MDENKPSLTVALLAAGLPLGTVPLGFVLFAGHAARATIDLPESGAAGAVAQAWDAGGGPMFACLAVAALASVGAAAGAFFAARHGLTSVIAVLIGAVLELGAGVVGFRVGMVSLLAAIAHASPRDRGIITAGAIGDAMWIVTLALFMLVALFVLSGAAFVVGASARRSQRDPVPQRTLGGLGLAVALLGAWGFAMARSSLAAGRLHSVLGHASAPVRPALLFSALDDAATGRRLELFGLVGVLLALVLLAALLRASALHLAGALGFVLVGVASLGGLRSLAKPPDEARQLIASALTPAKLRDIDARAIDWRDLSGFTLEAELTFDGAPVAAVDELARRASGGQLALELGQQATGEGLERVLSDALDSGLTSVVLVGLHTTAAPAGLEVPPLFRDALTTHRGLRLDLEDEAAACPDGCPWSTLSASGLVTPEGTWPLLEHSDANPFEEAPALFVRWNAFEPGLLIRGAQTAAAHQRTLTLVRSQMPSLDSGAGESLSLSPPETEGGLSKDVVRRVIHSHRAEIRACYERALARNPESFGRVVVDWDISPSGTVTRLSVTKTSVGDQSFEDCIVEAVKTWQFPKPVSAVVTVSYSFWFETR